MPVFIIVVWEIPIWLLVLAGLCFKMDIYNCGVISCKFNDVFWYATLCSKGK